MRFQTCRSVLRGGVLIAAVVLGAAGRGGAAEPASALTEAGSAARISRRTPLVELVERVLPSVVSLSTLVRRPDGNITAIQGTGSILHESGYIVTNHHVLKQKSATRVTLSDGSTYGYGIVAALPYEDLALIKIGAKGPLQPVRLGRSDDLMLGEDVLVIGNSRGLTHSVAPGIVSGLDRPVGVSPTSGTIQTDAAVNPGNSGGPLFNALGELIGVIEQKMDADNISFAIAVDRLREVFPEMMSPSERFALVLGLEVDTMTEPPTVTKVAPDSPACAAGVQIGDEVLRAGKFAVGDGLDFYMALAGCGAGEPFPLELKRDGKVVSVSPTLAAYRPPEPVKPEGLEKGLQFAAYTGRWSALPEFDKLEPAAAGTCEKFSEAVYPENKKEKDDVDDFALKVTGFVRVPADGLYFFYANSDDGSRLYIGDRLVVDNDLPHPPLELGGQIRLKAGLYPITVTFFERDGAEVLEIAYEGPNLEKQEIPPEALFFSPPPPAPKHPELEEAQSK